MIVSGFNVYPSEVEDVIAELPEVAEAAVIGVEDPETGEAVVAYVKPTAGRRERRPASTSYAGTARSGWPGSSSPR